jgi:hypothetical protein
LVAGTALATQQLPGIDRVSYVARAFFIITLVNALLATFFTCLQHRTYGVLEEPAAIRAWLADGIVQTKPEGFQRFQSSMISQQLLQVPFELLCISITTFLGGIGIYLGSSLSQNLKLGSEGASLGNHGVLIAFVIITSFILALLGQLLGGRDLENRRCKNLAENFRVGDMGLDLDDEARNSRENAAPLCYSTKESSGDFANKSSSSVKADGLRQIPSLITSPQGPTPSPISVIQRSGEDNYLGLIKALHAAAEAHRGCATAEAEVVHWYEKMSKHLAVSHK